MPPSMQMFSPVINPAFSEQRKRTISAISSGLPTRPTGCCCASASAGWLFTEEPFAAKLKQFMDSGKKDLVQCNNCGNAVRILPNGLLEPADPKCVVFDDLHKWAEWERGIIAEQIKEDNFRMELDADLFKVFDRFTFARSGEGKVTITNLSDAKEVD